MKSLSLALVFSLISLSLFAQKKELTPSKYTVTHHYTGVIAGKYKFLMNLFFDKDTITGEYRYYTQKSFLQVEGTYNDATKSFELAESVYNTKKNAREITGYFSGIRNGNTITGKWSNKDRTKTLDFVLSTDEKPINFTLSDNAKIDDDQSTMTKMVVKFPTKTQVIEGFESIVNTDLADAISLEDMNFDGYIDIRVLEFTGSQNSPHIYWIFDPKTVQFVKHEELTATDPVVDLQTKRIVSSWRDGAAIYGTSQYVFQDGKFYLIEEFEEDLSTNKSKTTKYKIENGKSVKIPNAK